MTRTLQSPRPREVARRTPPLPPPEEVTGKLFVSNAGTLVVVHLLALLAVNPAWFTWTGVVLVFVGNFVFGSLGVNIGFHRLLTHRAFRCPRWLEHTFTLLGVCTLQDSPARWVAIHRMHHQHSDEQPDPHSPLVSFIWGYVGWIFYKNRRLRSKAALEKYVPDLLRDPFYARLESNRLWLWIYLVHAALIFAAGWLAGWLLKPTPAEALQFGTSILVWGVFVRTVYVWHVTWSVNGVTHLWGYRNYETGENSRNNWIVSLLTNGEGWHNNHHAHQRSARQGHRWWEIDLMWLTIRLLEKVGLADEVVTPSVSSRLMRTDQPAADRVAA